MIASDPADFIAHGKLGSIYYEQNKLSDSEKAFKKALEIKADFSPAMINLGRIYLVQKQNDEAIEILKKVTETEPNSPRGFQLLGEAYLVAKKGTLGVAALNEALRLDPIGMAESHLLMARLYDLAGAKSVASREYQMFLEKVPEHKDKKKFEKYIKDNPIEADNE
jgi:predicted Zn-dependent protease